MYTKLKVAHELPAYPRIKRRKNLIDLSGQTFHRWTVLYIDDTKPLGRSKEVYWICRCECNTVKSVAGTNLRKGKTKSCGCYQRDMNFIDLEGKIFGRLYVVDMSEKTVSGQGKATYWYCKCICGNFVNAPTSQLLNGDSTSCGCKTRRQLPNGLKKYEHPEKKLELWNLTE